MNACASILLVDDDAPFRTRLARALTARGCAVTQATDAAEAQQVAQTAPPTAAVVDLKLVGASGLEIIRDLRARLPGLRIVMLTGYGSIATALEAVRCGAQDYLTKPADADQVLAALRGESVPHEQPRSLPEETPSLDRVEWEHIQRVLADCGSNISQAARVLGIDRRSLQRKLAKYPPNR
jgi:two-component system response regulator RegA